MNFHAAMVFLKGKPRFHPEAIAERFKADFAQHSIVAHGQAEDLSWQFDIDENTIRIARANLPFPKAELAGPCEASMLWPNAAKELKDHKTHFVISFSTEIEPKLASAILTRFTSAVLNCCSDALGVYWGNASLVIPKKIFIDFAHDVLPHENPMFIWIDFRVGKNKKGNSFGFTTGLRAFGLREIEVPNATEEPASLRQRLLDLSDFILTNGDVFKNGQTIGEDDSHKIVAAITKSKFGHADEVTQLNYSQIR